MTFKIIFDWCNSFNDQNMPNHRAKKHSHFLEKSFPEPFLLKFVSKINWIVADILIKNVLVSLNALKMANGFLLACHTTGLSTIKIPLRGNRAVYCCFIILWSMSMASTFIFTGEGSFTLAAAVCGFRSGLHQRRDRNFSISAEQRNRLLQTHTENAVMWMSLELWGQITFSNSTIKYNANWAPISIKELCNQLEIEDLSANHFRVQKWPTLAYFLTVANLIKRL